MNKEVPDDIIDYIGWLAPDGTHFSCDRYGHDALSRKLVEEYCKINAHVIRALVCDDMLIDMGWCRIGFSTFLSHGYSIQANWNLLSETQKSFIRDMYFQIGNKMTEDTINNLMDYEIIDLCKETKQVDNRVKKLTK